jgi:hypothetical protein
MTKSYEERFLEDYIDCDKEKEIYEEKAKKYSQIMDTLKQEEIKNVLDEALKSEASVFITCLKSGDNKTDDYTRKLLNKLSSETIYNHLNRHIQNIKDYAIRGCENHKKLLLQIKNSGLVKNYYDLIDVALKMKVKDVKVRPNTIFKCLVYDYKNTDYISELKSIMNEEFYVKLLNAKTVIIEQGAMDPFGLSFSFNPSDMYEISPESVRINDLEDVIEINVNGHYLASKEDMKNIGKYIEKGHNNIHLSLKTMPNKIQRSIVYLANPQSKM